MTKTREIYPKSWAYLAGPDIKKLLMIAEVYADYKSGEVHRGAKRMFQYQPPTPARSHVVYSGRFSDTTSRGTLEFVGKRLPPINQQILAEVKGALAVDGAIDQQKIVSDIKSDPALFLQCAKRLHTVADTRLMRVDPLEGLLQLEDDRLRALFQQPFPTANGHSLSRMTSQQALSLKVTIACTKFAEAMSKNAEIPAHSCYSNALFRQIGLNLVAWNYPSVYSSAMARHRKKNIDLHSEIERILGISPRDLGMRLAGEWGLQLTLPTEEKNLTDRFQKVMELAELCAQCEDSKNYPEAAGKLQAREDELADFIDKDEIETIQSSIEGNLAKFAKVAPVVEGLRKAKTTESRGLSVFLAQSIIQRNPLLMRTQPEVKAVFADVYAMIKQGTIAVEALRKLADEVVPHIGFQYGCLFLTGRETRALHPALRFGAYPLSAYSKVLHESGSCIRTSLDTLTPIRMDGFGVKGEVVSFLCASLNHVRHEGVLYLEIADSLRTDAEFPATLLFQIIRQTLKDALDGV